MGKPSARVLFLKRAALLLLLILLTNLPLYIRNYEFSGSPIGVPLPVKYPRLELSMAHISAKATAANVLRNASLHFSTPSRAINSRIERSVRVAIRTIGVDPDDPAQCWIGKAYHMNQFTSNESIAGNPLHLVLLLISVGLIFWKGRDAVRRRCAMLYSVGILLSFVLFCALLYWQMWLSRLHLPFFVLASVLIALLLEQYVTQKTATVVAVALLVPAIFFSLTNRSRSLIPWSRVLDVYQPRPALYFSDYHEPIAPAYIAAADYLNHSDCKNVALDSYLPDPEVKASPMSFFVYPMLALIHVDGRTRHIWYSGVNNLSSRYEKNFVHPAPCAVVCFECAHVPDKWKEYETVIGRAHVFGNLVVFSSDGTIDLARRPSISQ